MGCRLIAGERQSLENERNSNLNHSHIKKLHTILKREATEPPILCPHSCEREKDLRIFSLYATHNTEAQKHSIAKQSHGNHLFT
ncbi:hypothetical protein EYF80_013381 [Liparis tanakae]|uniref:Uncharacterized protein n=1 Tax=Liparis tanakae TaxID=230148 RepID=A0A4Z2IEY9_9TELE|nr:hypothetical protein EYF80_013381 [Liparis tanakae]